MSQCPCGGETDREMRLWLDTPSDHKACEAYVGVKPKPKQYPVVSHMMTCKACERRSLHYGYNLEGYPAKEGEILPGWRHGEAHTANRKEPPEKAKPKKKVTSRRLF
ncbi:hypothetical protein GR28A_00044 [Vibrio phage vB_VcorM_GR28A]|nr:hypothetical protein GR28A_00044 [Vibrio phage vB_VcorM_GR28A]